jgi:alpha-beta hydrolase superfamily lysophospholipase
MDAQEPTAAVLLIHGMSDSPYSMRNLALSLHEKGASVVGLRVPGHGTAPSGLVRVRWQDMTAAVRLAMQHVSEQAGDKPLIIIGYSNGGALALEYALRSLDDPGLSRPDGLVLISPAIGVTKLAAMAVWQGRIGRITTLDKLAWNSIGLEYDPYKYGSFAVNAGDVTYQLTLQCQQRIDDLRASGKLNALPPVLAFQSALDATISAPALVNRLFKRLPPGDHELVLFDINRTSTIKSILINDPGPRIKTLLDDANLQFTLRLLTNKSLSSKQVVLRSRIPGVEELTEQRLGFTWPRGVYSLSHVALPFPEDDPLYGRIESELNPGIQIGSMELRGERNMTRVPAASVLRLQWNPFYDYLEQRVIDFVAAPPALEDQE